MFRKHQFISKALNILLSMCMLLGMCNGFVMVSATELKTEPKIIDYTKSAVKIATVGDSITYGADPNDWNAVTYPRQMQKMLGSDFFVYNFGWYGTTAMNDTPDAYTKNSMFQRSKDFQPDIVIIMLGTNDSKGKYWSMNRKDEYKNDLKQLIKTYEDLDSHPVVFLASSPTVRKVQPDDPEWVNMNNLNNEVYPAQLEVVAETGVKYIDMHTATADLGTGGDGVHGFYPEIAAEMNAGLTSDADFLKFKLNQTIVGAETLNPFDYTDDSLAALESDIVNAKEVLANELATLSDVDQAITDLVGAHSVLKFSQSIDYTKKVKVAAVGDSITFGAYADKSYPEQLQALLGNEYEVSNFGVNGRTMLNKGDYPYVQTQQYKDSLIYSPDVVILMLGTNDSKPQNWAYNSEFIQNATDLVHQYQSLPSHPIVFLATSPTVHGSNGMGITSEVVDGQVVPAQKALAQQLGLRLIDTNVRTYGMGRIFPDTVHGNNEGYLEIAKIMYNSLKSDLGVSQKALIAKIGSYSEWNTNRFTPESWELFEANIATIKAVAEDAGISLDQIAEAYQQLLEAERELVYVIDDRINLALPSSNTKASTDSELSAYPLSGILVDDPKTFWGTDKNINPNIAHAEFSLDKAIPVNRVDIREYNPGNWGSVASYTIEVAASDDAPFVQVTSGTTIGTTTKMIYFDLTTAKKVRLTFYPNDAAKLGGMNFSYIGIFGFPELDTQRFDQLMNQIKSDMNSLFYETEAWSDFSEELKHISMILQKVNITQEELDEAVDQLDAAIQKVNKHKIAVFVDDQDTSITYTGALNGDAGKVGGSAPNGQIGCYNNSLHWANSNQGESTITYTFTGTGISIISSKNVYFGILDVTIDDSYTTSVDCYDENSSTVIKGQNVFTKRDLPYGEHTVKIVGGIKKSDASIGTKIEFDGFFVYDEQKTDPSQPDDTGKTILSKGIDKATELMKSEAFAKLAPAVQEHIKNALDNAITIYASETTNEAYINAWLLLADAMHYMDFAADKNDLYAVIERARTLDLNDYVAGVEDFKKALKVAEEVYADKNALQLRIDNACETLEIAMNSLIKNEDTGKAMLEAMLEEFKKLDLTIYCNNDALTAFRLAITEAEELLKNDATTVSQIHEVILNLTSAYVDIRLLPNEEMLQQLKDFIVKVESIDLTQYSAGNVARIISIEGKVRMMVNDPNTFDPAIVDEIAAVKSIIDYEANVTLKDSFVEAKKPVILEEPIEVVKPTEPGANGITKTGDATNVMAMMSLVLASGAVVYIAGKKRKARK